MFVIYKKNPKTKKLENYGKFVIITSKNKKENG